MELKSRKDIPTELTWDLSSIYATEEEMYRDVEKLKSLGGRMAADYKGKLDTPRTIDVCLDDLRELERLMTLTGNYCDLAVSVDYYDTYNQERNEKLGRLFAEISSALSFIDSELVEQDEAILREAIEAATDNKHYLEDVLRNKPHQLHPEVERALAALSQSLYAPYQIYNMAKLADMKFDAFQADGKEYPLGYSLFEDDYEYEKDTRVRRAAFAAFSRKIREYENVTAAAYNTQVQTEKTMATLRGFDSVFDSLLFGQKVTKELYHRQIDLITEKLAPHMRRYARLLQRIHGLDKMTFADLKIAIDPEYDPKVTIEESRDYIEKGLSILGEEYVEMVRAAYRERWVDFAQNAGKSTGGFCASPYGKNSFILLSWNNRMADVFTLAHELGHAGHFKACNSAQSIFDTNVSTYFVVPPLGAVLHDREYLLSQFRHPFDGGSLSERGVQNRGRRRQRERGGAEPPDEGDPGEVLGQRRGDLRRRGPHLDAPASLLHGPVLLHLQRGAYHRHPGVQTNRVGRGVCRRGLEEGPGRGQHLGFRGPCEAGRNRHHHGRAAAGYYCLYRRNHRRD